MPAPTGSFQLFNELSEHITLRIASCSVMRHPPQWQESKQHPDYDLWIVLEGTVRLKMRGCDGTAMPGDLILFYPHVPYRASTGEEGCRFLYIHFDFGIGDRARILDEFSLAGIVDGTVAAEETALIRRAFERYRRRSIVSHVRLKGCLTLLLARILEHAADRAEAAGRTGSALSGETRDSRAEGRHLDVLQPVFAYLQEQLHRPIAVRELASLAGMSEKYFITFFKQTVGVTPGYYMYQMRMNRARDYLYEGGYSIKQIAEQLGYPDPYTFSKAFKKYYNRPPSQFV